MVWNVPPLIASDGWGPIDKMSHPETRGEPMSGDLRPTPELPRLASLLREKDETRSVVIDKTEDQSARPMLEYMGWTSTP